jgi:cardiolipin synthase A/B
MHTTFDLFFVTIRDLWPAMVGFGHFASAITASTHIVLTKEDSKSATGWVGLVWLSPVLGVVLYYILGINRIRRKAVATRPLTSQSKQKTQIAMPATLAGHHLEGLARLSGRLTGRQLTSGNRVTPLQNGDEAYPVMLKAIREARTTVALSSYIFDNDSAGQEFLQALGDARTRGVDIRVLVDATGARYSFPSITRPLKKLGIRSALFMPNLSLRKMGTMNLRSHRKILVVDGQTAFTGGLNIREGNLLQRNPKHPIQDLHFQFEGPVVGHIRDAFVEDWAFTTGETLSGDTWLPELTECGDISARGILDGPDENFEKILFTILGAASRAQKSIRIITPYFLPDQTTSRVLSIAALSGVEVDIIIPEKNNIKFVEWATFSTLEPLLRHGVRVHLSKPPFDHSKMVLVDDSWAFVGSSNWDSRSFQLNFEFNIECYSDVLVSKLDGVFKAKRDSSRPISLLDIQNRRTASKVRDGVVKLLSPYL